MTTSTGTSEHRLSDYVQTFRETARATSVVEVSDRLDRVCSCLESAGSDSARAEHVLNGARELHARLAMCELGNHRDGACAPFFEVADRLIGECGFSSR